MKVEELVYSGAPFEGDIISMRKDRVMLPNGTTAMREVVEHDPVAAIVPIDDDGYVLLVRQYRYPIEAELLEISAGGIEGGEAPVLAARRELREETGFASNDIELLGQFWSSPGWSIERIWAFAARDLAPSPLEGDDDE